VLPVQHRTSILRFAGAAVRTAPSHKCAVRPQRGGLRPAGVADPAPKRWQGQVLRHNRVGTRRPRSRAQNPLISCQTSPRSPSARSTDGVECQPTPCLVAKRGHTPSPPSLRSKRSNARNVLAIRPYSRTSPRRPPVATATTSITAATFPSCPAISACASSLTPRLTLGNETSRKAVMDQRDVGRGAADMDADQIANRRRHR